MPSRSFTALDGSRVRISGPLSIRRSGATSFVIAVFGTHRQEFGCGDLRFGESIARAHELTFDEEYRFQGGRLRLGAVEERDPQIGLRSLFRLGVWEGKSSSLKTFIYGGTSSDLIAAYDQFTIEETPSGVTLHPVKPNITIVREGVQSPRVIQPVPELGILDIHALDTERARRAPSWSGRRVRGGELFVDETEHPEGLTLVLLGDTAMTRIYPYEGLAEDTLVERSSNLEVAWTA